MWAQYRALIAGNRNFRKLWIAQIISEIGDWFYAIAIYTLLLELTGRASSVGIALVLQMLPQTLVGPAAGVICDRLPRRALMIFADIVRMVVVLALLLVRTPDMVWLAYVALGVETVMAALFEPARTAIVPNVVSEDQILPANTLMATTWSFNLAIGAALGGALQLAMGRDAVFLVNALSFLASALLIGSIGLREVHAEIGGPLRARELFDFRPMVEGARYIVRDARLTWMVFLKGFMGLMGASWVLYPVFAERLFARTLAIGDVRRAVVVATGILIAARGIGALTGPLLSSAWVGNSTARMRNSVTVGFFAGSVGYALFASAPSLTLACLGVAIAHGGTSCVWVNSTALLQLNSDDRYRGRVFAADLGLAMLTISATSYAAGQLIDHGIAPRTVAAATAFLMLAPTLAWAAAQRLWAASSAAA